MKPGEFVRWNGRSVRALMIQCRYQDGYEAIIGPDSPDYALAVAALQSLIRPSLDPEQCCNCRFWWHQSEGGRFINGWCRRHPPAPAFPGSLPDDWCGEYERERPMIPDFPLAVAAFQSLIKPSLDPRSGRVLAMGEVLDEDYIDGLRRCRYVSDQPWTRQS